MIRCNAIAPENAEVEHTQTTDGTTRKEVIEVSSIGQFNELRREYPRLDHIMNLVFQLLQTKPRLVLTLFFEDIICSTCESAICVLEGFVLVNE
jgi:hypothetical protein